jgi:hypothetical protein
MKKCHFLFLFFLFLLSYQKVSGQAMVTQTFIDKCTGETKIATTTFVNGNAVVSFYDQIRTFTTAEVNSGMAQSWLLQVKTSYELITCPVVNPIVTQTVQQTVTQAVSSAASSSVSSAASSAVGSSSSSSSSSNSSSSSSSESSSSSGSSESESSESSSESKSEENKEESKSEEKKEDKKKQNTNPMLLSSDLTTAQSLDGTYALMLSSGVSRTSMAGDKSYGASAIMWSTLDQYVLSTNYTKMDFDGGKLNSIHSYGTSIAYLKGTWMSLVTYTFIKPHPKIGTYGVNVGGIGLLSKNTNGDNNINLSTTLVGFWTKPFEYSRKLSVSPQVFIMLSPISYQPSDGKTNINRDLGFLIGSSFDYKLSKRFGFTVNYRTNVSTSSDSKSLHNLLVGSRMIL